jgi:hypothetical protein
LFNLLAPTLDASQTVGGITELCRKPGMDISRFGMFPVETANESSLPELQEISLNSKRTWFPLENAIILVDRQGGQIRSSGNETGPHQ